MFDHSKLYGKIREIFKTQDNFANAMGMSRSTLSLKMSGAVDWKSREIFKACQLLRISLDEVGIYFFYLKSLENHD